jgi:hypothetical protein
MRLPPDLAFRTKGQLAIDLLTEDFADGIRLGFVCGDEVYGSCTQLREFLEPVAGATCGASRRPGDDPAHRPGDRSTARSPASAWRRWPRTGLAAPSPGPVSLVSPARPARPRHLKSPWPAHDGCPWQPARITPSALGG